MGGGEWESGPFGVYHRKRYQTYTAKNLLERVAKKRKTEKITLAEESETGTAELQIDSRPTRSSLQATDMKRCTICQTEKTDEEMISLTLVKQCKLEGHFSRQRKFELTKDLL